MERENGSGEFSDFLFENEVCGHLEMRMKSS